MIETALANVILTYNAVWPELLIVGGMFVTSAITTEFCLES